MDVRVSINYAYSGVDVQQTKALFLAAMLVTLQACGHESPATSTVKNDDRFVTLRTADLGSLQAKLFHTLRAKASASSTIHDDGAGTVSQDLGPLSYSCSWYADDTYECDFPGNRAGIPLTGAAAKDLLQAIRDTEVEHEYTSSLGRAYGKIAATNGPEYATCSYQFFEVGYTCSILYNP